MGENFVYLLVFRVNCLRSIDRTTLNLSLLVCFSFVFLLVVFRGDELLTDSIADCGYPTVCGNYNEKFCFLIDGNERDVNCCVFAKEKPWFRFYKKKVSSRNSKAGLEFPVGYIARFLKAEKYVKRAGDKAPVFLVAVLEYLEAEVNFVTISFLISQVFEFYIFVIVCRYVLELAGNAARSNKKTRIIPRHIQLAECALE
ncbi:hypothetical protein MTR67_032818 [Solanum verrucosum]|uniref:Histone H2A n=1 Tax=Solanum verrucosum TaxID=315347 RepID=A0AAF0U530_SOLVR|nr:hypothetical protein MTR67_032818 [Solanum verrucosum]